jgi:hypothetical protein
MKIKKLNFQYGDALNEKLRKLAKEEIIFLRPFGAKLFRVYNDCGNKNVAQVLSEICTRYHKGVWYFNVPDDATQRRIANALLRMGYGDKHLVLEPEETFWN